MNPHTNAAAIEAAKEKVKLANERFGYRLALRMVFTKVGLKEAEILELLELARKREMKAFEEAVMKARS